MSDESANRNPSYNTDRPLAPGVTRLGSTTVLTGDIEAHEDLLVEGRVHGKITVPSGTLTIAKGAKVEVMGRKRGWVQVANSETSEKGWIYAGSKARRKAKSGSEDTADGGSLWSNLFGSSSD